MTIINLVTDKTVDTTTFTDSQISVKLSNVVAGQEYTIVSRFSNYQDLFKILAIVDILRANYAGNIYLYCPYILGARSDRRFQNNQSFDLKIITNILNSCNFKAVAVLDPHSDVLPALINNSEVLSALEWIQLCNFDWTDKILVSPDAGAYKKIFHLGESLKCPVVTGNKVRLEDGSPDVVIYGDVSGKDCVIIDDICDGGRTFISLGKKLKEMGANTVTLFVTHGIFSYGTELENIDNIYTTNSYRDLPSSDKFNVINLF